MSGVLKEFFVLLGWFERAMKDWYMVTVNHHAAGPSPAPGANLRKSQNSILAFSFNDELPDIPSSEETRYRHYCSHADGVER
jgi:hypothetical protein